MKPFIFLLFIFGTLNLAAQTPEGQYNSFGYIIGTEKLPQITTHGADYMSRLPATDHDTVFHVLSPQMENAKDTPLATIQPQDITECIYFYRMEDFYTGYEYFPYQDTPYLAFKFTPEATQRLMLLQTDLFYLHLKQGNNIFIISAYKADGDTVFVCSWGSLNVKTFLGELQPQEVEMPLLKVANFNDTVMEIHINLWYLIFGVFVLAGILYYMSRQKKIATLDPTMSTTKPEM